mmetsp:Transcript_17544/g.24352  ORF Transcript_17544/g.24352 Transcript_17544/m.24352 type:complete len:313 (+) Transcript_17544:131-1069(+)
MAFSTNTRCLTRGGFEALLSIDWSAMKEDKQTLFPVWKEGYEYLPHRGAPSNNIQEGVISVRASKAINMHPCWRLDLTEPNGNAYCADELICVTLVDANDKQIPKKGTCLSCEGSALLICKKPMCIQKSDSAVESVVKDGTIQFSKLQIGCCSGGKRGHGSPFCLKIDFLSPMSPYFGCTLYSIPIDVGAKSPFIAGKKSMEVASKSPQTTIIPHNAQRSSIVPAPSTFDGTAITKLLKQLNLDQYAPLFVDQEIDVCDFLLMKDQDLIELGIDKAGPRIKLRESIEALKKLCGSRGCRIVPKGFDLNISFK